MQDGHYPIRPTNRLFNFRIAAYRTLLSIALAKVAMPLQSTAKIALSPQHAHRNRDLRSKNSSRLTYWLLECR